MKKYLTGMLAILLLAGAAPAPEAVRPRICLHSVSKAQTEPAREENLLAAVQESRKALSDQTQGNALTLEAFDTLTDALSDAQDMTEKDVLTILDAIAFAAEKHQGQMRKNLPGTPYISHPLGVAADLVQVGGVHDKDTIIAALLHDMLEETQASSEEIKAKFGSAVADYVKELTEDKSLPKDERRRLQVIHAAEQSQAAAQVRLANKLYNLRELLDNPPESWSRNRTDRYFQWSQSVVDRLPEANPALKEAVEGCIASYWAKQAETPARQS